MFSNAFPFWLYLYVIFSFHCILVRYILAIPLYKFKLYMSNVYSEKQRVFRKDEMPIEKENTSNLHIFISLLPRRGYT